MLDQTLYFSQQSQLNMLFLGWNLLDREGSKTGFYVVTWPFDAPRQ